MSETVITWNFENVVTITLMAALGFVLLNIVGKIISRYGQ